MTTTMIERASIAIRYLIVLRGEAGAERDASIGGGARNDADVDVDAVVAGEIVGCYAGSLMLLCEDFVRGPENRGVFTE